MMRESLDLDPKKGFSIKSWYIGALPPLIDLSRTRWFPRRLSSLCGNYGRTNHHCSMCKIAASHLFANCKIAASLWDYMLSCFRVCWAAPDSMGEVLNSWSHQSFINITKLGLVIWNLVPSAICWSMWEEPGISWYSMTHPLLSPSWCILLSPWNLSTSLLPIQVILSPFRVWIFDWDSMLFSS